MNNGNQNVGKVVIREIRNVIYVGSAIVNGQNVEFCYNYKADKFTASSLSTYNADKFGFTKQHNWMYLVCGSIAHSIKNNINVEYK